MKRIIFLVAGLMLGFSAQLFAENPNIGTSGAQFLKIPVGPRATAMGGAFVSSADDASALFWNPAGIAQAKHNELFASYASLWAGINLSHAALIVPTENLGSFGVSMSLLSVGEMDVTTELQPEGTGQKFDAQDLMLGVSYARHLTEDFAVGVTMKLVHQRIWNESANGVAFDVGTQYRIGIEDLAIGMSMSNFGPDMRYDGRDLSVQYDGSSQLPENRLTPAQLAAEDYPLPLYFQVGVSMTVVNSENVKVHVAADAAHPNDNKERVNVGTEVTVLGNLFLRGGYRFGYDTERATFGAGVIAPLGGATVTFDYAYAVYDLLPSVNRFSVGVRF